MPIKFFGKFLDKNLELFTTNDLDNFCSKILKFKDQIFN